MVHCRRKAPSAPATGSSRLADQLRYPEDKQKKLDASSPALPPAPANSMSMAKPRPQVTLTFDWPLWHAVIANIDGRTNDEWSDGAFQYVKPDGTLGAMVVPPVNPGDRSLVPNFGKDPFPDMAWASRATYTRTEAVAGHKCFVFKKDDMTAWIDAVSLYPVQWQHGDEMRKYVSLPDQAADLPTEVQKVAQDYQRYQKMITRPPPSGG